MNRYCYVQGNPISFTDPFGLSPAFNLESFAHGVLDFLGCFPVIGTIADITQEVMYANEGDTFNMSLCIISAVASGVAWVGKLGVKCGKLAKATKYISTGARLIENAAVFTVSAGQAAETARGMWKKYAEDKQPVGAETLGEVATLGLSIFAAGTSAKSFGMNGNKLKSMAVKEKLGGNGGCNHKLLFGNEWNDYLSSKYGSRNVDWRSHEAADFATEGLRYSHYKKHGSEFKGLYKDEMEYLESAREVMFSGYKVSYSYKNEVRTGYVQFMGNGRKGNAKFAFVGTNNNGYITTFHTESGKTFWKMLNGENIPVINQQ